MALSTEDFNEDDQAVEPFRIPNAAELIAAHLRRQIVRGELPEGNSLPPEGKLRARFGVSGPTLRAAYRVLEAEGLITVRRGSRGGAQVNRPTIGVASRYVGALLQMDATTLDDLFEARIVLEPPLAGMTARTITKTGLKQLRTLLEQEEAALKDGASFARLTSQFHQQIIDQSGNQTLRLLASLVWSLIERQTNKVVAEAGERPAEIKQRTVALHAHQRLLDLIEQRDSDAAEAFWRKHMIAVGQLFAKREGGMTVVELFD